MTAAQSGSAAEAVRRSLALTRLHVGATVVVVVLVVGVVVVVLWPIAIEASAMLANVSHRVPFAARRATEEPKLGEQVGMGRNGPLGVIVLHLPRPLLRHGWTSCRL